MPGSKTNGSMPVRAASVWRQISERAESSPLSLPSVKGELANERGDRRLQRQADAHLGDHVLFAHEIEIGLDGRGAKHHVEAAGPDFRHVAGHDLVAAFRHRPASRPATIWGSCRAPESRSPAARRRSARPQDGDRVRRRSRARRRAARPRVRTVRPARAKWRRRRSGHRGRSDCRRPRCRSQPSRLRMPSSSARMPLSPP